MILGTGMEILGMVLCHPERTLSPCAPLHGKDTGKEDPLMVKKGVSSGRQRPVGPLRDSVIWSWLPGKAGF